MSFVERQRSIRQTSILLVLAEFIFVLAFSAAFYLVFLLAWQLVLFFVALRSKESGLTLSQYALPLEPSWFFAFAIIALVLIFGSSFLKFLELKQGGVAVARLLRCRRIYPSTEHANDKTLLNIVQEIAIACGMRTPLVFLMSQEEGINAFAAGYEQNDAVIGVTEGGLQYLTRDELQGVMAHEFSHIANGDIRLNIILSSVLHGINLFYVAGRILVDIGTPNKSAEEEGPFTVGRRRRRQKGQFPVFIGYLLMGFGWVGRMTAALIQAQVSRQREYLADASAVQFTRNPSGISGALKKVGGLEIGSTLHGSEVESYGHFFFANALSGGFTSLFSTHPPLTSRIQAIDPNFNGHYLRPRPIANYEGDHQEQKFQESILEEFSAKKIPFSAGTLKVGGDPSGQAPISETQKMLESIPRGLRELAQEPYGARGVVYALLLSDDEDLRLRQIDSIILTEGDPLLRTKAAHAAKLISRLPPACRLPLFDVALPALHELSPEEYHYFRETLDKISQSKPSSDTFEYAVFAIIERQLAANSRIALTSKENVKTPQGNEGFLAADAVLYDLAAFSHESTESAYKAYLAGRSQFGVPASIPAIRGREAHTEEFHHYLLALSGAPAQFRERLLRGCSACVESDGTITVKEMELIRAIGEILGLSVAPLYPSDLATHT